MPAQVLFFPGLKGHHQFAVDYQAGGKGYSAHLEESCAPLPACSFRHVDYQTADHAYPLISEMGAIAATALQQACTPHTRVVGVGSSVGAGVLLNGMAQRLAEGGRLPDALVLIGPVYDPLTAVAQFVGAKKCAELAAGEIQFVAMPVSSADGQADPGQFFIRQCHMADKEAVRVLQAKQPARTAALLQALQDHATPITILTGEQDHFSPPALARHFLGLLGRDAAADQLAVWSGGHNSNAAQRFADASREVTAMVQRPGRTAQPRPQPATATALPG